MGDPFIRGPYAYGLGRDRPSSVPLGTIVDFQDGSASIALPDIAEILNPLVTGPLFTTIGQYLQPTKTGLYLLEYRAFIKVNWGKTVYFGYQELNGPITEIGEAVVNGNESVLVRGQSQVMLEAGKSYLFYISSNFEYSPTEWSSVQILAAYNQPLAYEPDA